MENQKIKEAIDKYKEHMRQALQHQQEAYFCMVEVLSILTAHEK